jgi:hypothetical protein
VYPKKQNAESKDGKYQNDAHHDHQRVGFPGRGDERRQMMSSGGMKRLCHQSLLSFLFECGLYHNNGGNGGLECRSAAP